MDFYEMIKTLSDEELQKEVKERIEELEEESKVNNANTEIIGYKADYNPENFHITELEEVEKFNVDVRCLYSGYARKGLRFVYGIAYDDLGITSNDGRYYYIDDDSYILDFCRYIKDEEVINEYELFDCILDFARAYYRSIKSIDREAMLKMITKSDRIYHKPINEHKLSWFKGRGNAMCSEYAIMAGNILNVFGINSYLVVGREQTGKEKGENHAFNLINFTEKETDEEKNYLIDFCNYVEVFDMNYKPIGISPFIGELKEIDEDLIFSLVEEDAHLTFQDYSYMIFGKGVIKIGYDRDRDYYIDNQLTPDIEICKIKDKNKENMI